MLSKISLGSAQFGLNYGVANTAGQIKKSELKLILKKVLCSGIDSIDTAVDYEDSESNIGNFKPIKFNIVTKLPEIPSNLSNIGEWVKDKYMHYFDSIFKVLGECEDGRDINNLLNNPICHSGFKRLN